MVPSLPTSKAYIAPLQMQSHGLSMTSISIKSKFKKHLTAEWMAVSKNLCNPNMNDTTEHGSCMNLGFANHGEEKDIYPLTTIEIAKEIGN